MFGICFKHETDPRLNDQWSFVFSNFGVTEIWERGFTNVDSKIYQPTVKIDTAAELPDDRPLIVLAPETGRYIQGDQSLVTFEHPDNAIYLFGGSHSNLSDEEDLGGRGPDMLVYIPTVKHEMYGYAAGYIVLYDRLVKRGGFG